MASAEQLNSRTAEQPCVADRDAMSAFQAWRPDREICPKWASLCVLYRTMLNARREPGVRFCCSVPADLAPRLAEVARNEGCEATISPNQIDRMVSAISIIWRPGK